MDGSVQLLLIMLNDVRYAFRTLRQNPGFSITAVVSIAVAIGANATIFSLSDGLLFRPLPVPDPSQIVALESRNSSGNLGNISYADYLDFRAKTHSFDGLVAFNLTPFGFAPDAHTQSAREYGFLVSGNFFQVLRVEPQTGRAFRPEEDQVPGRDAVVVLSNEFWQSQFGGKPSVIGRQVRLNGIAFTVIGVAPEYFTGMDQYFHPSFFVPAAMAPKLMAESDTNLLTDRSRRAFIVDGRLRAGVSFASASAEVAALADGLAKEYPATNQNVGALVRTELQRRMAIQTGDTMIVGFLSSMVLVALLIACANVANLMLSRGRARAREIAVRLAIGAGRVRLVRQLMAESLLIAIAGGAVGLLLASFAVEALSHVQLPADIPIQFTFRLDARVLWFTFGVSMLCAIIFGLIPAIQSTKTDLVPALKSGELDANRRRLVGRSTLVVIQVAGSLVLLIASTQLLRGFGYLLSHNPGFAIEHRVLMSFDPGLVRYTPSQAEHFYKTVEGRAKALPGVVDAALTFSIPMGVSQQSRAITPEGYHFPPGQHSFDIPADIVDTNYFSTMGIPLLRGRTFGPDDRADSLPVIIVNEAFARQCWGLDANPIGKRVRLNGEHGPWLQVVGMTLTGKYFSIIEPPTPYVYLPLSQNPQMQMTLVTATASNPAGMAPALRAMVRSVDPEMPLFGVRTMQDFFDQRSVKVVHLISDIVVLVDFIALSLALVGLYAVVAYQVNRRTREIGIRMAIGADRGDVVRMVLKNAAVLGTTGVAIGVVVSFAGGRALAAGLGIPAFDPMLFALVPVLLVLTTMVAAAIPARRASRIDPILALRQD